MKFKNLVGLGIATWAVKKVGNKIAEEVARNEYENRRLEKEEEERNKKYEKERLERERRQKAEENRENFRESLRPNLFVNYISEEQFKEIVKKVTKKIKRIDNVMIEDGKVKCKVVSQSGISYWRFTLDFNDFGVLSGCYWIINRGNYDSSIVDTVGDRISGEIKRINGENKDYVYMDSDDLYPLESFAPKIKIKQTIKKEESKTTKKTGNKTTKKAKKKKKTQDNDIIALFLIIVLMLLSLAIFASIL